MEVAWYGSNRFAWCWWHWLGVGLNGSRCPSSSRESSGAWLSGGLEHLVWRCGAAWDAPVWGARRAA